MDAGDQTHRHVLRFMQVGQEGEAVCCGSLNHLVDTLLCFYFCLFVQGVNSYCCGEEERGECEKKALGEG